MKQFFILAFGTFALLHFLSCSTETFNVEEGNAAHLLKLNTITEKGGIGYPIELYAYSGDTEVEHITVASPEETAEFCLTAGTYTVYAVSGGTDFSKGYSVEPLMMGKTTVVVEGEDLTKPILLDYAVAKVSVALYDVPETAASVCVNIGELYNGINVKGENSGAATISLPCHRKGKVWVTDTVYVLPSCKDNVTLTVEHSAEANSSVVNRFTYNYSKVLLPGYPYSFRGSYTSGISFAKLTVTLEAGEWEEVIVHDFAFGEGANKERDANNADIPTFYVDVLPAPCSVWDGHIVATIDADGNALLFGREELCDGGGYDALISDINGIINNYREDNISYWRVPSEEDFLITMNGYYKSENYMNLNELLTTNNYDGLKLDNDFFYLCDGGKSRFSLMTKKTSTISSASKYCLRLVKSVKFVLR